MVDNRPYTSSELAWAEECIAREREQVACFLIEMRRTSDRKLAEIQAQIDEQRIMNSRNSRDLKAGK